MRIGNLFSSRKSKLSPSEARKARSIERLRSEAVPLIEHLPALEEEQDTHRRTSAEVALRALGAMIAAVKGETRDEELIEKVIGQYDAEDLFSPAERAFIHGPASSDSQFIQFTWRYEAAFVLLWATGFYPALPYPSDIVDVPDMAGLFSQLGREGLIDKAVLRPQSELLDAADLTYRYHWAVRNARLVGRAVPSNLDPGVVSERHYALNWLVGPSEWDNVSTDT